MRSHSRLVIVALTVVSSILVVADVSAQAAGRVAGTVTTPDGTPIEGVKITISAEKLNRDIVKTTNKKGKFTVSHSDATLDYQYTFEKEGFQTLVVPVNPPIGGTQLQDFEMVPLAAGPPQGGAAPAEGASGGGSHVVRTFNEGVEAQRLGDLDLAERKYREASEMAPELAAPHTALAAVAALREDWATSAAEAEAAIALDPEDVRAMQIRFDAYRNLGDEAKADEAAADLRKVGDLDAAAKRIFNEGVDAYTAGDVSTAQSKFRQAIDLSPEFVAAYIALAQISLTQGSPAESLAMAQSALELEPDENRALRIGFDAARLTGDTATSGQMLGRLVELDPEWVTTVVYNHAVQLFDNNQLEAAIFELNYVVQADPDMARAHFMLGMALYNSGNVEEGGTHLQRFIELAPDDPDVEIAKGLLSYQQ